MRTSFCIFEDNEAAIQHMSKRHKSYNASCITHTSCWFGLTLWLHQSRLRSNTSTKHSRQTFSLKDHSQETDGHNRHSWWTSWRTTTLIQSNLSVSSAVVNLSFSSKSERARESFATWASAKQWPVHCSAMIARKISDQNADMDYHAALPPEYQAWGHSKRETCVSKILNESTKQRQEHQARGNWKRWSSELRATGCCRRSFKWKERSSSSKYWRRGIHKEVRPSCKEFQAADWGGARIAQSSIEQYMCKIW